MKKIIFVLLLIIIVAGAGAPFFSGLMMEKIVKQSFNDINKMYRDTGSELSVEINLYDRSFYSSQIEWKIKLGALKAFYGVEEILFIESADHGFTGVVSKTSLEKNSWFTEFVNNKLNGNNPLYIQTEYKVFGNMESRLVLDGFLFKDGGNNIEIKPGKMVFKLEKGLKNIVLDMSWAGCGVPGKIIMDNLSFYSKMEKISSYIWDGKILFAAEKIQGDEIKEEFILTNLKSEYTLDYNDVEQVLSVGMGYSMDSITSGQDYINNVIVQIDINQINAQGYEDFLKLYSGVVNEALQEIAAWQYHPDRVKKAVEKQMTGIGLQMLGAYEKILKKGFEIRVSNLQAQLPRGNIKGDVTLSLKKDMTMAGFIPIMMQPAAALDVFFIKSSVSLPYELFGDNQWLLAPIYTGMQTGLFIKDGNNLLHRAQTRDDKLFLNGKEVLF